MSPDLNSRFFITTSESILLYGCHTWPLTESNLLNALSRRTYTMMLGKVTVESLLLYFCDICPLTDDMKCSLDRTYSS